MKLTYRCCGDYCLPNIGIPAEDIKQILNTDKTFGMVTILFA